MTGDTAGHLHTGGYQTCESCTGHAFLRAPPNQTPLVVDSDAGSPSTAGSKPEDLKTRRRDVSAWPKPPTRPLRAAHVSGVGAQTTGRAAPYRAEHYGQLGAREAFTRRTRLRSAGPTARSKKRPELLPGKSNTLKHGQKVQVHTQGNAQQRRRKAQKNGRLLLAPATDHRAPDLRIWGGGKVDSDETRLRLCVCEEYKCVWGLLSGITALLAS
jgi:hypothetical protein